MANEIEKVPIPQKLTLTIREAAEYSNIGIVKRREFEEFIHSQLTI